MTDFADFKTMIADWENREDWSDTLITSFCRMAEEYISKDLRVDWSIVTSTGTLVDREVALPDDWLDAVLILDMNGRPIRYKSNDEFYNLTDKNALGFYTLVGRSLVLGGTPDPINGITVTMKYYGAMPVFSDANPSWLYTKFLALYLNAARAYAKLHAVGEEDQAAALKGLVDDEIQKLNAQHLVSKASGSRITRTRTRSFG